MKSNAYRVGAVAVLAGALPLGVGVAAHPSYRAAARGRLYHVTIGVNAPYSLFAANEFLPGRLTVHVGDSVQWTNADAGEPQTVTFGPAEYTPSLILSASNPEINPAIVKPQGSRTIGDAGSIHSSGALMSGVRGLGLSYTYTFRSVGTYFYRSLFHPLMLGEIDVVSSGKPASADPPDRGDSAIAALRSTASALVTQQTADASGADNGGETVEVGVGNKDVSLNVFAPAGIVIPTGSTVTWETRETSGDPHVVVLSGEGGTANISAGTPMYTGVATDGGLTLNPAFAAPTLPSGTQIVTGTLPSGKQISSGILYGSSPAYPSNVPFKYAVTFMIPGQYDYVDPFHGNGTPGRIHVVAAP